MSRRRLKVFITVDVELWPDSWENYHAQYAAAYDRYILGRTPRGDYGLPFQLEMARDHGLQFVFFVESLFAYEFGVERLTEIVQSIAEADQEVQLHAHPEWARHARQPFIETGRRYTLDQFDGPEQFQIIETALAHIVDAGARDVRAFRAGSFAGNEDTLAAVARAGLDIDSSFKLDALPRVDQSEILSSHGVSEFPLSCFQDWPGHWRPVQLASCSSSELLHVLREAKNKNWGAMVILSHSAELLNSARTRHDPLVVRRFEKLCRFLADNESDYETACFRGHDVNDEPIAATAPILSTRWRTLMRAGEQGVRRVFG